MIPLVLALLVAAPSPTVLVDGTTMPASAIVTVKQKTYVALRAAASALNADVAFDGRAKTITFTTVVRQLIMRVGDANASVNGQRVALGAAPLNVGGRVVVPLRALAIGLGGRVAFDGATHRVTITSDDASPLSPGEQVAGPSAQSHTLQGTVNRVDLSAGASAIFVDTAQQEYRIAITADTKIQYRETRGNIAGTGSAAQVRPGDTLIAVLDESGALISMADIFTGYTGTVASVNGWSMVLTNGRVVDGAKDSTAVSLDGTSSSLSDLHAGDMVTVRADPKTGKVRDVVALSPSNPGAAATAAPQVGDLRIDGVTDNADRAFKAGQELRVGATGSRGAIVSFDIGDLVGGIPMAETQPGRYEGTYDVQVGTNFINAPIVVRAARGSLQTQSVAGDPLTIITTPPSISEAAPSAGAVVNNSRPSLFVTFATLGSRGMNPGSLQLWIDGVDVSAAATRTPEFISYLPLSDLEPGTVWVRLRGLDTAGNALEYKWSFVIANP